MSYDLRSEGIVTPVKLQSPWDSCWSFGGVAIKYCADRSGKYAVSDSQNQAYFCGQYTFDDLSTDHDSCIVGWDDNYDAANFSHTKDFNGSTLTNSEGTPLSEDDEVSFPLSYEQTKQRCEG